MGIFWDLIQQNQLSKHAERANTLEERVQSLEQELERTQELTLLMLERLEEWMDKDLDGDGKIGRP